MKIISDPKKMQSIAGNFRKQGASIGFVPTMGALHEGHLSLVKAARRENKIVVASIFVNPTQFGPKEDFSRYPRPFRHDSELLREASVDFIYHPTPAAMYPEGFSTSISVGKSLTNVLCGHFRPGHFDGVATVVAKLFNIVRPHRAYFGAKDFQQTVVIKRMAEDLDLNVQVKVLPTVREKDGLAMSSRNRYLSASERSRALEISRTLFWFRDQMKETNLQQLVREAKRRLEKVADRVQYFEVVDPLTLQPVKKPQAEFVALTACFVGKTRLIDNVIMRAKGVKK